MNSFLQGKKSLAVAPLRGITATHLSSSTAAATAPRPATAPESHSGSPTVELVKEGDKVVRIVVVCTCGERVEIDCLYPAGG